MRKALNRTINRSRKNAIVRCSCATGVRWAGFVDSATGAFTAITTIQTPYDVEKFMDAYGVDVVTTQYIDCA